MIDCAPREMAWTARGSRLTVTKVPGVRSTMSDRVQLLEAIHRFLDLQESLRSAFFEQYPELRSRVSIVFAPKRGEIGKGGEWAFQRHGTGMAFRELARGTIVDVPSFEEEPLTFDAFRLVTFLESIGVATVEDGDAVIPVTDSTIAEYLRVLLSRNDLIAGPYGTFKLRIHS